MWDDICENCGEECRTKTIDVGIGAYEYAGAPGYDSRPCEVSECCEGNVVKGRNTIISTTRHKARNGPHYLRIVTQHQRPGRKSSLSVKKVPENGR